MYINVVAASDCRNLVFLYDIYYTALYSQWRHYDMDIQKQVPQ